MCVASRPWPAMDLQTLGPVQWKEFGRILVYGCGSAGSPSRGPCVAVACSGCAANARWGLRLPGSREKGGASALAVEEGAEAFTQASRWTPQPLPTRSAPAAVACVPGVGREIPGGLHHKEGAKEIPSLSSPGMASYQRPWSQLKDTRCGLWPPSHLGVIGN